MAGLIVTLFMQYMYTLEKLTLELRVYRDQLWASAENQVNGEFIQILHTGDKHWVCVASVGCGGGTVNLYDSLYHGIIYSEVEDQVINLVGQANFTGIQVVPVQQQQNGSD